LVAIECLGGKGDGRGGHKPPARRNPATHSLVCPWPVSGLGSLGSSPSRE
jgi:hypothetical protein